MKSWEENNSLKVSHKRKAPKVAPLSDEELRKSDGFGKTFGLLADVPDEDLNRIGQGLTPH